jgi:hypothetical protein
MPSSIASESDKVTEAKLEHHREAHDAEALHGKGDAALDVLGDGAEHHEVTPEQDRRVLRKIDLWVMPVVLLVYFLQQLDKYVFFFFASFCRLLITLVL